MRSILALAVSLSLSGCVVTRPTSMHVATAPPPAEVRSDPPPPKDEPIAPRPGYVFVRGQWSWQSGQWVWVPGQWERERAGSPPTTDVVVADPGGSAVGGGSGVIALALGENHTCSLSSAGQVRCWGYNKQGSLGIGTTQDPADGIVTGIEGSVRAIAAGGYQTCALTSAGRVWCWGSNHAGQVGNGSVSEMPVTRPTRIDGLDDVRSLYAGDHTTCAIRRAGELYCWGDNSQHQIDDSFTKQVTTPTRVAGIDRAELVAVGNYHLCVVSKGRVRCRGELAPLDRELASLTRVTAISAGWGHSCALQDGKPYCWGKDYLGVLGRGPTCGKNGECASALRAPDVVPGVEGATQLDGHDYHSCVLLEGGAVTCWGNNQGHAFSNALPAEPAQTAHVLDGVTADVVYAGGVHVCTLRGGTPSCRGNDWAGAVRGAAAR